MEGRMEARSPAHCSRPEAVPVPRVACSALACTAQAASALSSPLTKSSRSKSSSLSRTGRSRCRGKAIDGARERGRERTRDACV